MADQHRIAGPADFRPILLEAGQDREIGLIHDGAAEALDVA